MTERQEADERMNRAKRAFSLAAQAALYGDRKAGEKAKAALAEVNKARADLERLHAEDQRDA